MSIVTVPHAIGSVCTALQDQVADCSAVGRIGRIAKRNPVAATRSKGANLLRPASPGLGSRTAIIEAGIGIADFALSPPHTGGRAVSSRISSSDALLDLGTGISIGTGQPGSPLGQDGVISFDEGRPTNGQAVNLQLALG
jgi:hypothetical protein